MTGSRKRIAVIGGGANCEHDVSLASAASVVANLDRARYDVIALTVERDGRWRRTGGLLLGPTPADGLAVAVGLLGGCAAVLPVLHGPGGEDGTMAALCELAGVPYAGSGVRAGAIAMDKWATKLVAAELGQRTARGLLLTRSASAAIGSAAIGSVALPAVVKPVGAGSSHGVALVETEAELAAALDAAFSLDDRVLVEELVVGREIDVAVLARRDGSRLVGPPLEIVKPAGRLFDLEQKYGGSADFRLPAQLDDVQRKALADAAAVLFDALGCAGVARFDFFLTEDGLVLNEVNTMPGLTEQSQVPRMFAAGGLPYSCLLDEMIATAIASGQTANLRR